MAKELNRLEGWIAFEYADDHRDALLCKHPDPVEPGREGLTMIEASAVARRNVNLLYVDVEIVGIPKPKSKKLTLIKKPGDR